MTLRPVIDLKNIQPITHRSGDTRKETRQIKATIAGIDLNLTFGTFPEILETLFSSAYKNEKGIIGGEIFDYFNIGLSKRRKEITFAAVESFEHNFFKGNQKGIDYLSVITI